MELHSVEYSLMKTLKKMNVVFKASGNIPTNILKNFCSQVLSHPLNQSRFVAMFESCYDKSLLEQKEFYQLSRKIDYAIVSDMERIKIFKDYDNMMNKILSSDDNDVSPIRKRYDKLVKQYHNDGKTFKFISIVIPTKLKTKKQIFKFDPANLM